MPLRRYVRDGEEEPEPPPDSLWERLMEWYSLNVYLPARKWLRETFGGDDDGPPISPA